MMRRVLVPAVAGIAVMFVGEGVRAADYPEPPQLMPIQEFTSTWYFRLDGGYGVQSMSGGSNAFTNVRLGNAPTIGGGFGFKKDWFRADVTVDYGSGARFVGDNPAVATEVSARIVDLTTLFNAYFDLGTWSGFTPYIGAGVGFSYLRTDELSTGGLGAHNYDLAWAGNAGVAYNLSRNFLLDLSYRYLDFGTPRASIATIGPVTFGNIATHQVRLGLRYQID